MLERLRTFWNRHVVQQAPAELARCEFDCKVTQCQNDEWETCEKRILHAEREIASAKPMNAGPERCGDAEEPVQPRR